MKPFQQIKMPFLAAGLILLVGPTPHASAAPDSLPDCFEPGQLLWHRKLGTRQYTVPLVDRGRLFVGINDVAIDHPVIESSGGGILLCLDEGTGEPIWQLPVPRYMKGRIDPFHFNHWKCGVCSQPAVDDDRLYIVAPRGDVLCVDRNGQADGNDGPFLEDARYMGVPGDVDYQLRPGDGDILWQYNLITQSKVVPHDVCGSSPMVHGRHVYACTSNGVDGRHDYVVNPDAPSLVVLDKITGELAATDGSLVGKGTLHGNWSSPVAAEVDGRTLIFFGGGDGVMYVFEPWTPANGQGSPGRLNLVWKHDCCPADYRERDGLPIPYARWNKNRPDGPSEIIATPVIRDGRVYIAIGQSPLHGAGKGMLSCLNATTGEVIWETREVDRSLSRVVLHDGLLYIPDYTGKLHCLDAENGEQVWAHELGGGVWCASPIVAGGNLYIGTEKLAFWVMKAGGRPEVVARSRVRSMSITPAVFGDVFYLPTQTELFALSLR